MPDHEWSSVVGVDASGHVVSGASLFLRATTPGMPPATVAERATQILGIGGSILQSGADAGFGTPAEKALVTPPAVTNGVLTIWMLVGEMAPSISRVTVTLATGDVEQVSAASLVPPPEVVAPPS